LRRFDSPIANLPLRESSGDFFATLSNHAAGMFAAHHPLDVDAVQPEKLPQRNPRDCLSPEPGITDANNAIRPGVPLARALT